MREPRSVIVVQTAFVGDVILTLPMIQILKKYFSAVNIDVLVTPQSAPLLAHHPAIRNVIVYDKRRTDSGVGGFFKKLSKIKQKHYDCAIVPHRSLRSAALVSLAGIQTRVGFDKSSGSFLYSNIVRYEKNHHEVKRNISLLKALEIQDSINEYPKLYPSDADKEVVNQVLSKNNISSASTLVGIAPGTVWNTKRWLKDRFIELAKKISDEKTHVVLIGGEDDAELCNAITKTAGSANIFSTAGKLTLLQSAELIRRCSLLVCNDSAPMHLAVAMGTPVVAMFGATIPEFGFAPYGKNDTVIETKGLACRPCSIHGGKQCPIESFDCMVNISADIVYNKVIRTLGN